MQITLYHRTFPVPDAPFAVSFAPPAAAQRHTFTAGGQVYEAEHREVLVTVPDDAKLDVVKNLLVWTGEAGPTKSTAREVYELARSKAPGFRAVKL
jgi:hypothetical protein